MTLSRSTGLKPGAFARVARKEAGAVAKLLRKRKCAVKSCRKEFMPAKPFERWCSPDCGTVLAMAKIAKQREATGRVERAKAKVERAADKVKKIALKPRKWWLKKAKTALHAFIRAEDEGRPCISCDTILRNTGKPGGDYDAGHFRSVGSAKHLEFDERNIFGQCKHCNDHMKGNQLEYERRLRIRKGDEYVDAIKADQAPRRLTISDFQQIEATYKAKLKELRGKA